MLATSAGGALALAVVSLWSLEAKLKLSFNVVVRPNLDINKINF